MPIDFLHKLLYNVAIYKVYFWELNFMWCLCKGSSSIHLQLIPVRIRDLNVYLWNSQRSKAIKPAVVSKQKAASQLLTGTRFLFNTVVSVIIEW